MKSWLSIFFSALLSWPLAAFEIRYKSFDLPSAATMAQLNSYGRGLQLELCCQVPEAKQLAALKTMAQLKELRLSTGYFPSLQQIQGLEGLGVPYEIWLTEVLPGAPELAALKAAKNLRLMVIRLEAFLDPGQVEIYNQIAVPLRLDLTMKELPMPEDMDIMQGLHDEIQVGFHHHSVPAPGYAAFFNELPNPKFFTIEQQFPWGDDGLGFNMLEKSQVLFVPGEQLLPHNTKNLNTFKQGVGLNLSNQDLRDPHFFQLLAELKIEHLELSDSNFDQLLAQVMAFKTFENSYSLVLVLEK